MDGEGEQDPQTLTESIRPEAFHSRLQALYTFWEEDAVAAECDALLLVTGKARRHDDIHPLVVGVHLWLMQLIFPETLLIFFRDRRLAISAREKKLSYFRVLEDSEVTKNFELKLFERATSEDELRALFKTEGTRVGTVWSAEKPIAGRTGQLWMDLMGLPKDGNADLDEEGYNKEPPEGALKIRWKTVDRLLALMPLKPAGEDDISCSRLAAVVAARMAKEVVISRVVTILDEEVEESHKKIAGETDAFIESEAAAVKWKAKFGINPQLVQVSHCLIESGGQFTLDVDREPSDAKLHLGRGAVVVGIGIKYQTRIANIARTILMDVGDKERGHYSATLDLQTFIFTLLKPGIVCKEVFELAWKHAEDKSPDLCPFLTKNFGGVLGNQLAVKDFMFDESSTGVIEKDMIVHVCIAAPHIAVSNAPPIAIWVADTAVVGENGVSMAAGLQNSVWTSVCKKRVEDIVFSLGADGEKENSQSAATQAPRESAPRSSAKSSSPPEAPRMRTRTRRAGAGISLAEQERLLSQQRELRKRKVEELRERFRDGITGMSSDKKNVRKLTNVISYRDPSEYPKEAKSFKIFVDQARESLLVPIGHLSVPFHVSTIRSVTQQEEGKSHILRISFIIPGAKTEESPLPDISNWGANALFIKEIIVTSADQNIPVLHKNLRELMKKAKMKEANRKDEDISIQHPLQLNKSGRRLFLRNLMCRFSGGYSKKISGGNLEAHANGFRFQARRMENIDILYSNIRYAFFQPVTSELIILLHFHLKSPVMIQRKRVPDIQFYCEAVGQADDLDARRNRSTYDPDELLEEQRENERKKKLNMEFRRFVEGVQEYARFKFEIPIRNISFHGVPHKSDVVLMPTQNCLVNLPDWPSTVIPIDDIEIVTFERVVHGLRHFDMVIIYKDYQRPVSTIATIPVESLDMLKTWLNEMEVVWYELKNNLQWSVVLKTIMSDIGGFVKQGGFTYFLGDERDIKNRGTKAKSDKSDSGGESSDDDDDADEDDDDDDDAEYQEDDADSDDDDEDEEEEEESESGSGSGSGEDERDSEEDEDDEDEEEEEEDSEEERGRTKRKSQSPSPDKARSFKKARR